MTEFTKLRGQVPFPLAGEDAFLQFTVLDLAKIEEVYGEGDYFEAVERLTGFASAKCIILCLSVSLKRYEGDKIVKVVVNWDDPGFTLKDVAPIILDAMCLSINGLTYKEVLEEAHKQQEQLLAAEEKLLDKTGGEEDDPFPGSEASEELKQSDTTQDSKQKKSTD